jgi:hypothetical protein
MKLAKHSLVILALQPDLIIVDDGGVWMGVGIGIGKYSCVRKRGYGLGM